MKIRVMRVISGVFLVLCVVSACSGETVLVEAESFEDLGGWPVDQQFMDQMGSPYLLAHGLGEPVEDATKRVEFPKTGRYHVWVRTRDWVGPWKAPGTPGKFQVLIEGKPIKTIFGTEGPEWHWQNGGTVKISKKRVEIALHDLTGFEGRCDAIIFSSDADFVPPNEGEELAEFRRKALGLADKPADGGEYDLVVVGGGMAGTCAAISSARSGLRVALIQDRPVLGGNNSSEVRVWLGGKTNFEPYPRIGDIVQELDPNTRACPAPAGAYKDEKKLCAVRAEKNIHLFLNMHVYAAEKEGDKITSVTAKHIGSGEEVRFSGALFADCTGDGTVGFLAGAGFGISLKGHMGRTNLWRVTNTGKPAAFPRCPWALDLSDKPFPGRKTEAGAYDEKGLAALGKWFWESGFDHDPLKEGEYIRDWNFRAMYGAWDCLKNVDKIYPNHKLEWAAYISGMRESRRLLGDIILGKEDLVGGKVYADGCVPMTWSIDLHLPHKQYEKGFKGDAFISKDHHTKYDRPYWLPYRCLYSRKIKNLFMAGRDISVTHKALGAVRVMRTTGMMGEVVGMAASLCKKHGTSPRGVYKNHLEELKGLMRRGVGKKKEAQKPVLVDFEEGFDVGEVEASNTEVRLGDGRLRIKATNDKLPRIVIKAPEGHWDLSKYIYLVMDVRNPGKEKVNLSCRLNNKGWVDGSIGVAGGQTRKLSVLIKRGEVAEEIGQKLFGMNAIPGGHVWIWDPVDAARIGELVLFLRGSKAGQVVEIDNIRAEGLYKPPTEEELETTFFPFIDRFGQYMHGDWPGKTHSLEELKSSHKEELADLKKHSGPAEWNKYGGWAKGPRLESTGHFRVQKYLGKWWLVDPEGRLFWSHGIDCVRPYSSTPITERRHYFAELAEADSPLAKFYSKGRWAPKGYYKGKGEYETFNFKAANLFRKFGTEWERRHGELAQRRLRSWGMNTIANWSDEKIYLLRKTPYFATLGTGGGRKLEGGEGHWRKFADPFDASFEEKLSERLAKEKEKSADDPWCIGYFVDNELTWGDDTFLALGALKSPADQPGKKAFVEQLKGKYETIEKLNAVWGTSLSSWGGLLAYCEEPEKEKAGEDLKEFCVKFAHEYFRKCRDVVKKSAPKKLYMGCRFDFHFYPEEMLGLEWPIPIAAEYCDVVSFNRYRYVTKSLVPPEGIDKPLIIGEFHTGALDRGMFHTGLRSSANQAERGEAYIDYVEGALENRYIVGTHWFQYGEQTTTGRGDGENYQVGFVDICDRPYKETIDACREVGYKMYEYRMGK